MIIQSIIIIRKVSAKRIYLGDFMICKCIYIIKNNLKNVSGKKRKFVSITIRK